MPRLPTALTEEPACADIRWHGPEEVFVDGEERGLSPLKLKVRTAEHEVRVVCAGGEDAAALERPFGVGLQPCPGAAACTGVRLRW